MGSLPVPDGNAWPPQSELFCLSCPGSHNPCCTLHRLQSLLKTRRILGKTDLRTEPQLLHCYLLGSDVLLIRRQSPLPQAPDLILLQHFDPAGLVIQVRNSLTKPTSNAKHGGNRRRVVIESRGSMVFK